MRPCFLLEFISFYPLSWQLHRITLSCSQEIFAVELRMSHGVTQALGAVLFSTATYFTKGEGLIFKMLWL